MKPVESASSGSEARPRKYTNVLRAISETPWAILPSKLDEIVQVVALRAEGRRLSDEEVAERLAGLPRHENRPQSAPPMIAVLPLYGALVPRADMFTRMSGATSMVEFGRLFQAALENPQITAILLDVDSPGGTVAGTPELAAQIFEARGTKPIVAIANTMATSGAYYIATQADEVVASPSALLGSIGIVTVHTSFARMDEMAGVDVTVIRSGEFKAETNPFEQLSDEAKAHIQEISDEAHQDFLAAVARGRGISPLDVATKYGAGRVVTAEMALGAGMVDRIASFEKTVARLIEPEPSEDFRAAESGLSFADEALTARVAAEALVYRTSSLAEVERGRLTMAKREQLRAVSEALSGAVTAIDGLLAQTTPKKHADALLSEVIRFEALRANL